jgi:hypothetical protein
MRSEVPGSTGYRAGPDRKDWEQIWEPGARPQDQQMAKPVRHGMQHAEQGSTVLGLNPAVDI